MPLYEYRCSACGEQFEIIQKFSDEPLSLHDKCGGEVARLISAPALQFKGTGWYITDYARGSKEGAGKEGAGNADKAKKPAEAASQSETKADSSSSSSKSSDSSSSSKSSDSSTSSSKPAPKTT